MSTRNSPSPNDDMETASLTQQGESDQTTPSMDNLYAEIVKMSTMLQGIAEDILTIKHTTSELKNTVNRIQEKLDEAEGRIHQLEDTAERLLSNREHDEKRMDTMWNRMQVLENHSKRHNGATGGA